MLSRAGLRHPRTFASTSRRASRVRSCDYRPAREVTRVTGSGFRPARRARPGQAEHGSSSSRTHLMLFGGSIREQSRCPVGVGVAEQFLHRRMSWYTVVPRRFTTNGWSTRLKRTGSGYGFGWSRTRSPQAARSRSHPQCAPPDWAPELCADGQHRNAASVAVHRLPDRRKS